MEALYMKLYEKYSKLKSTKENPFDQVNQEQEVKFLEFVSASEKFTTHLTAENEKLVKDVDELRNELISLRSDKDQQIYDLQELLMQEKQKNLQLSLKVEQLELEKAYSNNRINQREEQRLNSDIPTVTRPSTDETPMRMTRKRARLFEETNPATSSPTVSPPQISALKELSTDKSKRDASQTEGLNEDPCKYLFQVIGFLIGMKISVADQPEGMSLSFVHPPSGYSFSLTWVNKSAANEGELLYRVSSLGTFEAVALEWMKETIVFSTSMCPIFFERVTRAIKQR